MDLQNHSFKGYKWREALVVGNKIVCFGLGDNDQTFALKKEEEEKLRVVTQAEGFGFDRFYNASASVCKKQIYAFQTKKYDGVYYCNVETGKWSLYYSQ